MKLKVWLSGQNSEVFISSENRLNKEVLFLEEILKVFDEKLENKTLIFTNVIFSLLKKRKLYKDLLSHVVSLLIMFAPEVKKLDRDNPDLNLILELKSGEVCMTKIK